MEQRKLIQHGPSSLTVSLPSKWLKHRHLKKGDTMYVQEEGNKLILSTSKTIKHDKISVDVSGLDRTSAILYIQSLYRFGYNEIEVTFKKPTTTHYRTKKKVRYSSEIHYIVTRCIGAEVVEQTDNKIVIKYITREAEEDFRVILRRIFHLLKDTSLSLVEGIEHHDMDKVATIEEKHDNINNFTSYCLRLLNKYGYPDVKKTCFYYHIIASIDKIVDIMKYTAREVVSQNTKFHQDSIAVLNDIHTSIGLYIELFYKFSPKTVSTLSQNRDHVKFTIQDKTKTIPPTEIIHLTRMVQALEIILDLTDARMGLEY